MPRSATGHSGRRPEAMHTLNPTKNYTHIASTSRSSQCCEAAIYPSPEVTMPRGPRYGIRKLCTFNVVGLLYCSLPRYLGIGR